LPVQPVHCFLNCDRGLLLICQTGGYHNNVVTGGAQGIAGT
jgi:predicted metal-binding protein